MHLIGEPPGLRSCDRRFTGHVQDAGRARSRLLYVPMVAIASAMTSYAI